MNPKVEQTPAKNPNPVLKVSKDGTVLYSNEAGEPLLREWYVAVGDKLPSNIGEIVQRVISHNSQEKKEIKAGNRVYLISLHYLPDEECVNIYGFDISFQKEYEEKLRTKEKQNDVLHQIGKIALENENIKTFMDESVELIASILDLEYCKIMELLPDGKFLMRAGTGWKSEFVGKQVVGGGTGSQAGYTLLSGMPVIVEDFEEEKRFNKPEILGIHGVASGASVIIGSKENIFGVLVVNSTKKRKFTSDDTYFLNSVAFLIAQVVERNNAEEALRISEEKFRTLSNTAPALIWYNDKEGKNVFINQYFLDFTGKTAEEIRGTGWYNLVHPDDAEAYVADYMAGVHEKRSWYKRARVHRYDDTWRWLDNYAQPLLAEDGTYMGHVGVSIDVTSIVEAEEALTKARDTLEEKVKERTEELEEAYTSLKESEERLSEAQALAHIGNWDWNLVTGEVYWSDELFSIFGLTPQKFGLPYNNVLNYILQDDRDYVDNAVKEAFKGKPYSIDYRLVSADGAGRMVHALGEVIFNDKNSPVKMKGILQDITELKKVEEKIKCLANIVESSHDAIGTISLDGIITSWNKGAEQIYGYSAKEILGKHVSILAPSLLENETMKLIELIKQGKSYHQYETFRLGKDGKKLYVSITYSPVFDTNGKLTAISIIGRDITEHKKAEEALRNFEIAQKKEIHHRIKNNLQVISSLLDLQSDLFKGRENIRDSEVLKAFKYSIDRVLSIALIHEELYKSKNIELLNFSQYIKELVNNLLQIYRLEIDVCLNFDLEEDIFLDMDTAIPLGIVINEIVSNSFKYAFSGRDKGVIRIKLHKEEKGYCIKEDCKSTAFTLSISDNGVGIPEDLEIEDLDSLGLQLVNTLVDQLDGALELKRNNGTEFTIRFTVTEKDNQVSETNP